ncbi:hypothetical protein CRG98_020210 [Punica granatum]|uniref:G-patch domain-containing protein n=1 Tax=Punica granatum TaxID=22663 RepID=A0A2I0JST5_PUNGR|nr:hypothetical protein CRG98_020210 [Punica granatum]
MNVDFNRIRPSKTAVRAFDSSRREVNGEIDLGEEDYAIYKETVVPYISIGDDQNLRFHSFETISVIRDYGEIGPTLADRMVGKVLLRHNYIPGTELGAHGQGINRPIEVEKYKNRRGLGFRPSCHEIIEARRGKHLHRLAARYGKINRGIPVQPLSYFFPGPPHIVGDALAMLASMVSITKENLIEPLEIEIAKGPAHCDAIEATDEQPWLHARFTSAHLLLSAFMPSPSNPSI